MPQRGALLAAATIGHLTGAAPAAGTAVFSNARTDTLGQYVIFDVDTGSWNAVDGLLVDPAKVAVTATVASVDAAGVANTLVIQRAAGLRAEINQASPLQIRLWLEQPVFSDHSNISVSMLDQAITSGADSSKPVAALPVTNNNVLFQTPLPAARIAGIAEGRSSLAVMHSVVRGPWRAEAAGIHEGGLAGVEWTIVKNGQGPAVSWQGEERRSWYQDTAILSNAQWDANAAGGAEGGLGVWPSPAGDAATDPTGPVTITALFVPRHGGRARARSTTWTIYSAQAGAYPERQVWVDTVSGSDANDGLSAGAPKLTLAAACNTAGSATGGATQTTVPIVNIIGGTSGSPRDIEFAIPVSGSGAAVPSATDTWLTLRPAPGYARDTIRIVNHAGVDSGYGSRVRRLRLLDLQIDMSNSPSGSSSKTLFTGNASLYPQATNPMDMWFDGCLHMHRQGKAGQLTEGGSGNFVGTAFTKGNRCFLTNWEHSNTGQRGAQFPPTTTIRNARIVKVQKDLLKAPELVFGLYGEDNAVDPILLPINTITGTPAAGDVITGVFSWPASETVDAFLAGTTIRLTAGGNSYSFKKDDSRTHTAVTIASEVGTAVAPGQTVRNATDSIRFKVYRRDGNILRGEYTAGSGLANGNALTCVETGTTATVSGAPLNGQVNLFFAGSGARATAGPPHPDGLQVQTFTDSRVTLSGVVGTFQVGESVTVTGVTGTKVIAAVGADYIETSGTALYSTRTSQTITGNTSGATATIVMTYGVRNDANLLLANVIMRRMDGQLLFGENGSANVGVYNVLALMLDASSALLSSFSDISGLTVAHSSLPTQGWRYGNLNYFGTPLPGQAYLHNIVARVSTDYAVAGMPSGDDKGKPGFHWRGHITTPAASLPFSHRSPDAYVSQADPGFTNGLAWDESDNVNPVVKTGFRPTAAMPAQAVTLDKRLARYDLFGIERLAIDWPGAVSAR